MSKKSKEVKPLRMTDKTRRCSSSREAEKASKERRAGFFLCKNKWAMFHTRERPRLVQYSHMIHTDQRMKPVSAQVNKIPSDQEVGVSRSALSKTSSAFKSVSPKTGVPLLFARRKNTTHRRDSPHSFYCSRDNIICLAFDLNGRPATTTK